MAAHVLSVRGETVDDARSLAVHLNSRFLNIREVAAHSLAHFAGPEVAGELFARARKRLRRCRDGRGIEVLALLLHAARNGLTHDALQVLGERERLPPPQPLSWVTRA